jgi:two-component system KDP operon response regulator KdpE
VSRILVVDDEPAILRSVGLALAASGHEVEAAATARQALAKASTRTLSAIVLDLGLPDLDGLELLRQLRSVDPNVPIVVLSARDALDTRVAALDEGADDFVPKPFGMPELLARVRVALRHAHQAQTAPLESTRLERGPLVIDTGSREVRVDGRVVTLTKTQFDVLLCLARSDGRVLTHRMLAREVWGDESAVEPENLRVVISHVRKAIERDPAHPRLVRTEIGVGYRFCGTDPDPA